MDDNQEKEFIFFTLNNFEKEGGGTIRMYGLLNQLASEGKKVILISNAGDLTAFHPDVNHINLKFPFGRSDKRIFQGVVGLSPRTLSIRIYKRLFLKIREVLEKNCFLGREIYFLEYLDNTIGYLLRKEGWISKYFNDLHGIPTWEFKFRMANAVNLKERTVLFFKYLLATILDRKIYGNADGYIFATEGMRRFFEIAYPGIKNSKSIILPYLVSEKIAELKVKKSLLIEIKEKYRLEESHFVLLFAGGFKKTGGMTDLIEAFDLLYSKYPHLRMLMIGDGPVLPECQRMVKKKSLEDCIHFVGRTRYEDLRTYQEASDLLVCPDKQNVYSQLIIHVKYFDCLASNKVVINGSFPSVLEVNKEEELSISFEPSNVNDLADKIEYCIDNQLVLEDKYCRNLDVVLDRFTYSAYLENHKLNWF